jgi:hypothetical protein
MGDLRAWVEMVPDGFDFGANHIEPWEVVVRRPIVAVGPSGPVPTGKTFVRRYVDGELASTRTIEATDG